MGKVIYKYELEISNDQEVHLPKGYEILTVQEQKGIACMWVLHDDTTTRDDMTVITIYGTGHKVPDNPGTYVGTFQIHNGQLVFHVFGS